MTEATVYVVGAGLAGLSAAVTLAACGRRVEVIEAVMRAGGRCRSYFDESVGRVIDNGNHLVLTGNRATHAYCTAIGSESGLSGPADATFTFVDMTNGERWTVRLNDSAVPWWIVAPGRRVPGTRAADYLRFAPLFLANEGRRVDEVVSPRGQVWTRLLRPLLLAALNTTPESASAALAGAVLRQTLGLGGRACRPRVARPDLASVYIDPALAFLERRGSALHFGQRVRALAIESGAITALSLPSRTLALGPRDAVVLATPAQVTAELLPGTPVPDVFHAIINAHFAIAPPPGAPTMLGILGGTAEWIFAFADRISVTVSAADRLTDTDRAGLAELLWRDVTAALGLPSALPPWQIVKERRATFAATPAQAAQRAPATTQYRNLILAGDWTTTGLPATIEGAVRSGRTAARLAMKICAA